MNLLNNPDLFYIFALCDQKRKFVYEINGIFGNEFGFEEMQYWQIYNIIQSARLLNIKPEDYSLTDVLKEIKAEKLKQKRKK